MNLCVCQQMPAALLIHNRIAIALGDEASARKATAHLRAPRRFIQVLQGESDGRPSASERTFRPPSLSAVEDFFCRLSQKMESHDPESVCVVHTGSDTRITLMYACVLVCLHVSILMC